MTNEELWELFPIILSVHNPIWVTSYSKEKPVLKQAVGIQNIVRMNHVGSTAIPNLIAKPTIDILLEIKDYTDIERLISNMQSVGYIYSEQPNNPAPHMMFMKGYTQQGFKGQVRMTWVSLSQSSSKNLRPCSFTKVGTGKTLAFSRRRSLAGCSPRRLAAWGRVMYLYRSAIFGPAILS